LGHPYFGFARVLHEEEQLYNIRDMEKIKALEALAALAQETR